MARQVETEGDPDAVTLGVALLIIGIVAVSCMCCVQRLANLFLRAIANFCCCLPGCGFCRRRLLDDSNSRAVMVTVPNKGDISRTLLKQKKELMTAYMLLLSVGGIGGHHFYLNRLVHGIFCAWSFNFFGLGWIMDFFLMPWYVNRVNRGSATVARWDGSMGHVFLRLPCVFFVLVAAPLLFLSYLPTGLHMIQVVDLQAEGAGTAQNPYDLLGMDRDCSPRKAAAAYKTLMTALDKQTPCDSKCISDKQELKKANDFIAGVSYREFKLKKERKERKEGKHKDSRAHRRRYEAASKEGNNEDGWADWSTYKQYEWELLADILKDGLERMVNASTAEGDQGYSEEADEGYSDFTPNDEL